MKLLNEKWERSVQSTKENGENEVGVPSTITEPLPITITTLLEPIPKPVLDPDIEITSEEEEESFEPAKDNCMDVALMSKPTKIKARLPYDFSGRNKDATR